MCWDEWFPWTISLQQNVAIWKEWNTSEHFEKVDFKHFIILLVCWWFISVCSPKCLWILIWKFSKWLECCQRFVTKLSTCDFYQQKRVWWTENRISELVVLHFNNQHFYNNKEQHNHVPTANVRQAIKCFVTVWLSCMSIHIITIS